MSSPTLSDVRNACEASPGLKLLWDEMLNTAYFLNLAIGDALYDAYYEGKREAAKEAALQARTREALAGLNDVFLRSCAALTAKLDGLLIPRPAEVNLFDLASLYSGIPLSKSE
jgi:hypothetical protein